MKKKLLIVFVLLLICCICVLSGILGFYIYRSTNQTPSNSPASSPVVTAMPTTTATVTPAGDWKVIDKELNESKSTYEIEVIYPQITGYSDKLTMEEFNDYVLNLVNIA